MGLYQLGQVQRAQGRLDASARTCQQALEIAALPGRPPRPPRGRRTWAWGRWPTSGTSSTRRCGISPRASRCAASSSYIPPLATGLVTLAWIRQASGDPAGALAAIGEAEQASPGPVGLLNPVPAQRARLLLAQGDLDGAARWTAERGLDADDEPDYPREPGHLVLARVLLAQARPGPALALLDRLHAAAAAQDRAGSLIEIGALRALALAASGEEAAAVDALAEALTLACPQGYVRVFADEGPPMAALLARLIAAQRSGGAAAEVPLGCLARLQRALRRAGHRPGCRAGQRHGGAGPGRPADQPRAGGAGDAGGGPVEPGHRGPARGHPRHRQEARQPRPGQARRGQPHRGRRPGARAGPDPLTRPRPRSPPAPSCCSLAPRISPAMSTFG